MDVKPGRTTAGEPVIGYCSGSGHALHVEPHRRPTRNNSQVTSLECFVVCLCSCSNAKNYYIELCVINKGFTIIMFNANNLCSFCANFKTRLQFLCTPKKIFHAPACYTCLHSSQSNFPTLNSFITFSEVVVWIVILIM